MTVIAMTANNSTQEEIVLNTDDVAAKPHTMIGWLSRTGRFYGPDDERTARWDGATHLTCKCGLIHSKTYTCCDVCRAKARHERWLAMPLIEWDCYTPIAIHDGDEYFFSADSITEYCEDNDIKIGDLDLVVCEPNRAREIDEDYFCDELSEDGELPPELEEAINTFNAAISAAPPLSWSPGQQRVVLHGFAP